MKPRSGGIKPLFVELTLDERLAFDRLAAERGISLRDLVVTCVLGAPPTIEQRFAALEARVIELEHAVGSYLPVIRPVPDDVK